MAFAVGTDARDGSPLRHAGRSGPMAWRADTMADQMVGRGTINPVQSPGYRNDGGTMDGKVLVKVSRDGAMVCVR